MVPVEVLVPVLVARFVFRAFCAATAGGAAGLLFGAFAGVTPMGATGAFGWLPPGLAMSSVRGAEAPPLEESGPRPKICGGGFTRKDPSPITEPGTTLDGKRDWPSGLSASARFAGAGRRAVYKPPATVAPIARKKQITTWRESELATSAAAKKIFLSGFTLSYRRESPFAFAQFGPCLRADTGRRTNRYLRLFCCSRTVPEGLPSVLGAVGTGEVALPDVGGPGGMAGPLVEE